MYFKDTIKREADENEPLSKRKKLDIDDDPDLAAAEIIFKNSRSKKNNYSIKLSDGKFCKELRKRQLPNKFCDKLMKIIMINIYYL